MARKSNDFLGEVMMKVLLHMLEPVVLIAAGFFFGWLICGMPSVPV